MKQHTQFHKLLLQTINAPSAHLTYIKGARTLGHETLQHGVFQQHLFCAGQRMWIFNMPDQHGDFQSTWQRDVLDNMKFQVGIQHDSLLWFVSSVQHFVEQGLWCFQWRCQHVSWQGFLFAAACLQQAINVVSPQQLSEEEQQDGTQQECPDGGGIEPCSPAMLLYDLVVVISHHTCWFAPRYIWVSWSGFLLSGLANAPETICVALKPRSAKIMFSFNKWFQSTQPLERATPPLSEVAQVGDVRVKQGGNNVATAPATWTYSTEDMSITNYRFKRGALPTCQHESSTSRSSSMWSLSRTTSTTSRSLPASSHGRMLSFGRTTSHGGQQRSCRRKHWWRSFGKFANGNNKTHFHRAGQHAPHGATTVSDRFSILWNKDGRTVEGKLNNLELDLHQLWPIQWGLCQQDHNAYRDQHQQQEAAQPERQEIEDDEGNMGRPQRRQRVEPQQQDEDAEMIDRHQQRLRAQGIHEWRILNRTSNTRAADLLSMNTWA